MPRSRDNDLRALNRAVSELDLPDLMGLLIATVSEKYRGATQPIQGLVAVASAMAGRLDRERRMFIVDHLRDTADRLEWGILKCDSSDDDNRVFR